MQKVVSSVASVGAGRALEPEWLADTVHLVEYLLPKGAKIDFRRVPGVAFGSAHEIARLCDDINGKHEKRTIAQVEAMIAQLAIDPTLDLAGIVEPTSMTAESVHARWKKGTLQLHMRLADRANPMKDSPEGRVVREKAGFREALDLVPQEDSTSEISGLPIHRLRLGSVHSITQPDAYQLQRDALQYMVSEVPLLGAAALLS